MKKYGGVAIFLLSMAYLSAFYIVYGGIIHHQDMHFMIVLACLTMGVSLVLAALAVYLLRLPPPPL